MPKILCRCNNVLNLILSPSKHGYRLVSESLIDSLYGSTEPVNDIVSKVNLSTVMVYRCDSCGRLIVFWDKQKNVPKFYVVEQPDELAASGKTDDLSGSAGGPSTLGHSPE